jgi:hypothetical protein
MYDAYSSVAVFKFESVLPFSTFAIKKLNTHKQREKAAT